MPGLIQLRPELLCIEFWWRRRSMARGRRIWTRPRGKGIPAPVLILVVMVIFMICRVFSVAGAKGGLFPSITDSFPGKAGRNLNKGKDEQVQNRARATAYGRAVCCKARCTAADLAFTASIVLDLMTATTYTVLVLVLAVRRILLRFRRPARPHGARALQARAGLDRLVKRDFGAAI